MRWLCNCTEKTPEMILAMFLNPGLLALAGTVVDQSYLDEWECCLVQL